MGLVSVQSIFDGVRSNLSDTQVVGGEVFTNAYLLGPSNNGGLFGEPYRSMYGRLMGASKRAQRTIWVVLPANTSVLIPSTYSITDFAEPEMLEERPAASKIAIASTSTTTPIEVTTVAPHGLSSNAEGTISGVASTFAPWGNWFITKTGANTFTLNGSGSDGVAGTDGFFYPENQLPYAEVFPADLYAAGLDGGPNQVLGVYLYEDGHLKFRGASIDVELRITYYLSGTPPSNPNYIIPIDNCQDFLTCATTANAARSKGWTTMYESFRNQAYGDPTHPDEPSLLDLFFNIQVLASQRGPQRRQLPFRDKRSRYGTYVLG